MLASHHPCVCNRFTPLKINMKPEKQPFEKENHLSNPSFWGSMLVFRGVDIFGM